MPMTTRSQTKVHDGPPSTRLRSQSSPAKKRDEPTRRARARPAARSKKKSSSLARLPPASSKQQAASKRTRRPTRSTTRRQRAHEPSPHSAEEETSSSPSPSPPVPQKRAARPTRTKRETRSTSKRNSSSKVVANEPTTPRRRHTTRRNATEEKDAETTSVTPKKRRLRGKDAQVATPPKKKKKNEKESPSKALARSLRKLELDVDIDMSDEDDDIDMESLDRESYVRTFRDRLLTTESQFELKCREEESDQIWEFMAKHLSNKTCGSLYICGSPGTGKSATVTKMLEQLERQKQRYGIKSVSTMNAMSLERPNLIFSCLWEMLAGESVGLEVAVQNLEHMFLRSSSRKMFVVVLDEIDGLLGRQQAVLYRLFEWCHSAVHPQSKLILVGIANSIDLTDRFLPKLKSRCFEPELVIFEPYSARQLFDIVRTRLLGKSKSRRMDVDEKDGEEKTVPLFETKALEYVTGRVAKTSGDIRKCLELCRFGIEDILLNDLSKDIIRFQDIVPVLRSVFSSRHVDILRNLPSHQCNVVVVASVLVKYRDKYRKIAAEAEAKRIEKENEDANLMKSRLKKLKTKTQAPSITLVQLERFYKYMAQKFNLSRVSLSEFHLIVDSLLSEGLLSVASTGSRKRTVGLQPESSLNIAVSFDDLLYAMENHAIWSKFFEDINAAEEDSSFFIPVSCRG